MCAKKFNSPSILDSNESNVLSSAVKIDKFDEKINTVQSRRKMLLPADNASEVDESVLVNVKMEVSDDVSPHKN